MSLSVLSSRLLLSLNDFAEVVKPEGYSEEVRAFVQEKKDKRARKKEKKKQKMFGRSSGKKDEVPVDVDGEPTREGAPVREGIDSDGTLVNDFEPSKAQVKRATRTRLYWALFSSFCLLVSVVFLILVEIGNTSINATLNRIYFIKIDVSDIIPISVPNAQLINSIAQTLGLHDFYQVGLWNYCEGYDGEGVTNCSTPETLYWFNPVEIIRSQLLAGATIALPAELNDILDLIRLVSNWMFGLFLTGLLLNFLVMFLLPLSVYTRWLSLPLTLFTFLAALLTTAASIIGTIMFLIMQRAVTSATELNLRASLGVLMFAFMWVASGAAIVAFLVQLGMCCCCASRRSVRKGKKRGSRKAWEGS